ncbi:DPP IV N-terminal domain-containing protein [Sulfobacillus sp. hq2]|uniref:S9 family peptidase n=1 Tax=Sulfobacillus TaxID=28033 RepID=UPI000CD03943|nr:DPP IV N-terminal domain-containing protein [Sulfobacillus sp. hq2]POB10633.1 peptidase S9 [Sulfobacillus sp. hq2]
MQTDKKVTWEQIATVPAPGLNVPIHWKFTPDNQHLTYLAPSGDNPALSLWTLDLSTMASRVLAGPKSTPGHSLEEELRRERQRMPWEGITHYQFAHSKAHRVLIPQGSQLWLLDIDSMEQFFLAPAEGAEDPYLMGDGERVVFVRNGQLCLFDSVSDTVRVLAEPREAGMTCGLAEYVAQEEFDRPHGYFVSPNEEWIAFEEVDDRHIPIYPIVHWDEEATRIETHRYPFVGHANALFRLGVVEIASGATEWVDVRGFADGYLVDVHWSPDNRLVVSLLTRDQKTLTVFAYNPQTHQQTILWTEHADDWINVTHDMWFLDSGAIVTTSEQNSDGFRHVVLREPGRRERWVTSGAFMVTRIVALAPSQDYLFVEATKESPLERHLYRVELSTGLMERLTEEAGVHFTVFSKDCRWYVDQISNLSHSPAVRLVQRSHEVAPIVLHQPIDARDVALSEPELVEIPAHDGTILYGAVYHPQQMTEEKAPVVVAVYGGPHAQMVTRDWRLTVDLQAQYLAQHGFFVLKVDNRGSANRGKAFETAINRRFGTIELDDQIAGVQWLGDHYPVDLRRVGIYGWSYGGYMTLSALLKAPDVFSVGVAGAPVADFRWYDTAYTERYMGTDETNHEGYEYASTLNFVHNLQGQLLIIHGFIDENVHFRHTAQMIQALTAAHKDIALLALPKTRHMPRGYDVLYMIAKGRSEFFEKHLMGQA